MKERITYVHGMFSGIYGWGSGYYTSEKADKWHEYWNGLDAIYWHCFQRSFAGQISQYLVSTYGSGYLHPMDFKMVLLRTSGGELKELERICKECAEFCGGSFTLHTSHKDVDFD